MLSLRQVCVCLAVFAMSLVALTASAFPGNADFSAPPTGEGPSQGFITSTMLIGGIAGTPGCASCHIPTVGSPITPAVVTLKVNESTLSAQSNTLALWVPGGPQPAIPNFNVSVGSTNTMRISISQGAAYPKAGMLVFHDDASTNDANGTLTKRTSTGPVTTTGQCKGAADPYGADTTTWKTRCNGTTANNTEVMHDTPQSKNNVAGGTSGEITFDFNYTAPLAVNGCGVFPFKVWVNSVNDDKRCGVPVTPAAADDSRAYLFTITVGCTGGPCQACTQSASGVLGTCSNAVLSGAVCNAVTSGACDLTDVCDGVSAACADRKVGDGVACPSGADANICTNDVCRPAVDKLCHHENNAVQCGTKTSDCDLTVFCSGGSCPSNKLTAGTACPSGADSNVCTQDICNGVSVSCTHPAVASPGTTVCRASGGACDPQEFCSGTTCPADLKSTAVCRPSTDAICDPAESCDGVTNTCPADTLAANGMSCAADTHACTTDVCQSGACAHPSNMGGTQCGPVASCVNSSTLQPRGTCVNGQQDCPVPPTITCSSVCASGACDGGCTSDANCNAGFYCNASGACAHKNYGDSCAPSDCFGGAGGCRQCDVTGSGNNFCVDGVCCNSACGGGSTTDCVSCNAAPATKGTCSNQTGTVCSDGTACTSGETCSSGVCGSPISTVSCSALDQCHVAGVCNSGTGTCSNPNAAAGTPCGAAATCQPDGVTLVAASACNASGTCVPATPASCAPNLCAGGACTTTCNADIACAPNSWCDKSIPGGQCKPKAANGAACTLNNSCTSDKCVDGFCCNADCTGQCEACDVATKEGLCSPVVGAPHAGKVACATDGSACGGACDGTDRLGCAYPTTTCRAASCAAATGVATAAASCSGGSCPAVITSDCAPYICDATATQCAGNCRVGFDADCAAGNWCELGVCRPLRKNGEDCSAGNACESTRCIDGVCCNTTCTGQCQACDVEGSKGTCTTVPSGAPHKGRNGCAGTARCQGTCNGSFADKCGFPGAATQCTAPSCTAGSSTTETTCNGAGSCTQPDTNTCLPYACGGLKCRTQCASTADCAPGRQCIGVACVLVVPMMDAGAMAESSVNPPDAADDVSAPTEDAKATIDSSVASDDAARSDGARPDGAAPTQRDGGPTGIDVTPVPNAEYQGSCGCRVPGNGTADRFAWMGMAALAWGVALRRRASRSSSRI